MAKLPTKKKEERILNLSELEDSELIKQIQERGYYIARTPLQKSGQTFKGDLKRWSGRKYKFGVVSDTHLCSRHQQLSHLWDFYRVINRRRIQTVFHCGDLTDGGGGSANVYRGHAFEVFVHGADAQSQYAIDNYPRFKNIKTRIISGNHDQVYLKSSGTNTVKRVCRERSDMTYLGDDLAYIDIDGIKVAIMHGRGGVAYARSYKMQKILEQMAPENKPHFLFLGHFHVPNILPGYQGTEGIQMSCFQSQTPYLTAKGLQPHIAGLIVELQVHDSGLAKVKYEWIPFPRAKKNDF